MGRLGAALGVPREQVRTGVRASASRGLCVARPLPRAASALRGLARRQLPLLARLLSRGQPGDGGACGVRPLPSRGAAPSVIPPQTGCRRGTPPPAPAAVGQRAVRQAGGVGGANGLRTRRRRRQQRRPRRANAPRGGGCRCPGPPRAAVPFSPRAADAVRRAAGGLGPASSKHHGRAARAAAAAGCWRGKPHWGWQPGARGLTGWSSPLLRVHCSCSRRTSSGEAWRE